MRRIEVTLKRCKACKGWMLRKRTPGGRLEPPTRYAKRQTCSHACKGRKQRRGLFKKAQGCVQCGSPIVRKKYGRYYEPRDQFRRRRFCDAECLALWFDDDPLHRMEHGLRCVAGRSKVRVGLP